jgi:hypothetical protein
MRPEVDMGLPHLPNQCYILDKQTIGKNLMNFICEKSIRDAK